NLTAVADYWEQVILMNDHQKTRFAEKIIQTMYNTVNGKHIAFWAGRLRKTRTIPGNPQRSTSLTTYWTKKPRSWSTTPKCRPSRSIKTWITSAPVLGRTTVDWSKSWTIPTKRSPAHMPQPY